MDDLTCDHAKEKRRVWADYTKDDLSRVRSRFLNSAIDVRVQKGGDLRIQTCDVLIGPLNLETNAVKWMNHKLDSDYRSVAAVKG